MKKFISILITLCLFQHLCVAQKQGQELIDSLITELPKAKEDTNKANLLNSLGRAFLRISENEKSLEHSKKAPLVFQRNFKAN